MLTALGVFPVASLGCGEMGAQHYKKIIFRIQKHEIMQQAKYVWRGNRTKSLSDCVQLWIELTNLDYCKSGACAPVLIAGDANVYFW